MVLDNMEKELFVAAILLTKCAKFAMGSFICVIYHVKCFNTVSRQYTLYRIIDNFLQSTRAGYNVQF